MAIERSWEAQGPYLFTSNGGSDGTITVVSVENLKVKQDVTIEATGQPTLSLEIKKIISYTQLKVGPRNSKPGNNSSYNLKTYTDLSSYTVANVATIRAAAQSKPRIKVDDIWQAVFEREPTIALRNFLVDTIGNPYTVSNPFPVRLSDGSVNIQTLNQNLLVQLSSKDNDPNAGDVHDSVRIGDQNYEAAVTSGNELQVSDETTHTDLTQIDTDIKAVQQVPGNPIPSKSNLIGGRDTVGNIQPINTDTNGKVNVLLNDGNGNPITSIVGANSTRGINTLDLVFEERRDSSISGRTIYGRTPILGATDGSAVWQIWAEDNIGSYYYKYWANSDSSFIYRWSLRKSLLPRIAFLNEYSLNMNGSSNQYGLVDHTTDLDFANNAAFSFFGWVKFANPISSSNYLIQKASSSGGANGYSFYADSSDRLIFIFEGIGTGDRIYLRVNTPTPTLSDGAWHLIGFSKTTGTAASTVTIYIDSIPQIVQIISDTLSGSTNNTNSLTIGANISGNSRLDGNIDEFAFWNIDLSPSDVITLFNYGNGVIDLIDTGGAISSNLISWWRMGDGSFVAIPNIPDEKGGHTLVTQSSIIAADIEKEVP